MFSSILLIGFATAFNILVIILKIRRGRYADSIVDLLSMLFLSAIFVGSMGGMFVAMVSSFFISVYLWFYPVYMPKIDLKPLGRFIAKLTAVAIIGALITLVVYYSPVVIKLVA
jgi:hypothetical protein